MQDPHPFDDGEEYFVALLSKLRDKAAKNHGWVLEAYTLRKVLELLESLIVTAHDLQVQLNELLYVYGEDEDDEVHETDH